MLEVMSFQCQNFKALADAIVNLNIVVVTKTELKVSVILDLHLLGGQ